MKFKNYIFSNFTGALKNFYEAARSQKGQIISKVSEIYRPYHKTFKP